MVVAKYKNPNAQVLEGIALAHTIHGEPESARLNPERVGASEGTFQQVPQPHMSHYKPPARKNPDNAAKPLCGYEACKAYPSKKFFPYCPGHARTMKMPGADWVTGENLKGHK